MFLHVTRYISITHQFLSKAFEQIVKFLYRRFHFPAIVLPLLQSNSFFYFKHSYLTYNTVLAFVGFLLVQNDLLFRHELKLF